MAHKVDTCHESIVTKTVGHESKRLDTTGQNHRKYRTLFLHINSFNHWQHFSSIPNFNKNYIGYKFVMSLASLSKKKSGLQKKKINKNNIV